MNVIWSARSLADLSRLSRFLAPKSRSAAAEALTALQDSASRLVDYPRLGEKVDTPSRYEVRRIFVRDYELRYELRAGDIYIVRIWHARENR